MNNNSIPPKDKVAVANRRHVNRYYHDPALNQWYLVQHCTLTPTGTSEWKLLEVEWQMEGRPVSKDPVKVTKELWANRFADRPFDVTTTPDPDVLFWFQTLAINKGVPKEVVATMFVAYKERTQTDSSFNALVRLGLVHGEQRPTRRNEPALFKSSVREQLETLFGGQK